MASHTIHYETWERRDCCQHCGCLVGAASLSGVEETVILLVAKQYQPARKSLFAWVQE